jgi:vancomycin permeability regulator SanA
MLWPRLVFRAVAGLVALVLAVLVGTAAYVWWFARQDDRSRSDVIVVLGAAQFDGRPSSVLTARLVHARDLWRSEVAPRIITVGGKREGDRFTEAAAGARWLAEHGVPERRLSPVPAGFDTLSSVTAVAERMKRRGWESAVIVTDPWHALRTRSMAEDVGIEASMSPTRRGPAVRERSTQLRYIARETGAFLYWKIFHRSAKQRGPGAV